MWASVQTRLGAGLPGLWRSLHLTRVDEFTKAIRRIDGGTQASDPVGQPLVRCHDTNFVRPVVGLHQPNDFVVGRIRRRPGRMRYLDPRCRDGVRRGPLKHHRHKVAFSPDQPNGRACPPTRSSQRRGSSTNHPGGFRSRSCRRRSSAHLTVRRPSCASGDTQRKRSARSGDALGGQLRPRTGPIGMGKLAWNDS